MVRVQCIPCNSLVLFWVSADIKSINSVAKRGSSRRSSRVAKTKVHITACVAYDTGF